MKCLASIILMLLMAVSRAAAMEVREVLWNFDGQVVPEHFNLLSVRVASTSDKPYDGALRLIKVQGLAQALGAAYVQPCYLSPGGSRWVQFHVYVTYGSEWRLSWGSAPGDGTTLNTPKLGPPARVLLVDPEAARPRQPGFPMFPEDLFPATVAATDALDCVVLDHVPRWEAARRGAFLDWLRRGGTVQVVRDLQGRYPEFSDELACLNTVAERTAVGAGWVVRQAAPREALSAPWLAAHGFPAPELKESKEACVWQLSDSILPLLSQLSQTEHLWWLIIVLILLYIVAVGPGVFILAKRVTDYRLVLLALVGGVMGFSLLFAYVGRRGQGEAGAIHSLAYARALSSGQYQVTQWINVFVTHGDYYTLTHNADHNLYAVPQEYEQVNGAVQSGKGGRFMVDMPVFSQRSFLHQARLEGPAVEAPAAGWPTAAEFAKSPTLPVPPGFPAEPVAIWALYGDQMWALRRELVRLVPDGAGKPLDACLASLKSGPGNFGIPAGPKAGKKSEIERVYRELAPYLIAWSLGGTRYFRQYVETAPPAPARLHLFVLAPSPDSFRLQSSPAIGPETAYVLYDFNLTLE